MLAGEGVEGARPPECCVVGKGVRGGVEGVVQGSCRGPRMAHGLWKWAGDVVCRVDVRTDKGVRVESRWKVEDGIT